MKKSGIEKTQQNGYIKDSKMSGEAGEREVREPPPPVSLASCRLADEPALHRAACVARLLGTSSDPFEEPVSADPDCSACRVPMA